ncbi:hypothetical protein [uncultured Lamprocystis sp.]|uniref:type IV toxin-antitoxin system AbiEi family antitoxin domain-containing protein n=1 Tax=uncultured Lamprocystis sp. TaxID=543132 RepID=UPI0025E13100|nr:hypothetical protein [uncultured Lamprocystis sp.]
MEFRTAIALEIGRLHQPVVTDYQLGSLVFRLYEAKTYRGEALDGMPAARPERAQFTRLVAALVTEGILQQTPAVSNKDVWVVLGQDQAAAEDILCCVDPFCYLSHLSAMDYHGLTDRLPKLLFVTSLPAPQWGRRATESMQKALGAEGLATYLQAGLPPLRRLRLDKINRKVISVHTSVQRDPGAYVTVQGKPRRVATIGRTFLDMLRAPDSCGGIYHVMDRYAAEAPRYLRLIVDEIDRHGTNIDKVRAGYVLAERLKLAHPAFDAWRAFAQRGGSRKLYAQAGYSPRFSETWCLSINIDEADAAEEA